MRSSSDDDDISRNVLDQDADVTELVHERRGGRHPDNVRPNRMYMAENFAVIIFAPGKIKDADAMTSLPGDACDGS